MQKETDVKARISKKLKTEFLFQLEKDGITQSDFIITCILNYLGKPTVPDEIK